MTQPPKDKNSDSPKYAFPINYMLDFHTNTNKFICPKNVGEQESDNF